VKLVLAEYVWRKTRANYWEIFHIGLLSFVISTSITSICPYIILRHKLNYEALWKQLRKRRKDIQLLDFICKLLSWERVSAVFILNFRLSNFYVYVTKHRAEIAVGSLHHTIYVLLSPLPQITKVAISLSLLPLFSSLLLLYPLRAML